MRRRITAPTRYGVIHHRAAQFPGKETPHPSPDPKPFSDANV